MKRIAAAVTLVAALAVLTPTAAHARGPEIGGEGSHYYLNDAWTGSANIDFEYGDRTDRAYAGDWDGDGSDTVGIRRGSTYYLTNSATAYGIDVVFAYGKPADVTLVGDWNGDGIDTLAVRRGNVYYFTNQLRGGEAETVIAYGRPGDEVLVGDWDGDGSDSLAVRRGNTFYFSNALRGGTADITVAYGRVGDRVYAGDWDGDGTDTPVVRRGSTYYVKNSFSGGEADQRLTYGRAGDSTLVGDWNGDARDTLGVRRAEPSASKAWADSMYGTFTAKTYTGSGPASLALPAGARAGTLTMSHSGGTFQVSMWNIPAPTAGGLGGLGEHVEFVMRTSGSYSGTRAFGLAPGATTANTLKVDAGGTWKITVAPIGAATELPQSAVGDRVFLYSGAKGYMLTRHRGSGEFYADQYPGQGLFQIVEGYSYESLPIASGPSVVTIQTTGMWDMVFTPGS